MINREDLKNIKSFILNEARNVFKVYGNEIEIKAEDLNLLKSKDSCIRSSTAAGFILEEFMYQKFKNVLLNNNEFYIYRPSKGTNNSSYDFVINNEKFGVLINVKTQKGSSKNNAVAAIKQLNVDYNEWLKKEKDFYFIILKILYEIDKKEPNGKITYFNKLKISDVSIFCLEEIDFSKGYKQDFRNWSKEFKKESGRLLISESFYNKNKFLETDEISNEKTSLFLEQMIEK